MGNNGTITVFLADDHAMVREGLAALIARDTELRVVGQCGDGLKVVEQVSALRPNVVVLDITMPGLNGLDLCWELSHKVKNTAILILTMHDDEQFITKSLENGASGYLLKEAVAGQLAEAVRTVAGGQLYLGPNVPKDILVRIARGETDPHDKLTARERQVLQLVAEGKTNRQAADDLGLSVKTVDAHRLHLMRKLGIHDQTSLVKYALRKGIVALK
ncbi:MAG: response regulator transcription factor [Planctomycetota bacterium]|nr:response regulator transcription factor [Planctomycetota bacterium]